MTDVSGRAATPVMASEAVRSINALVETYGDLPLAVYLSAPGVAHTGPSIEFHDDIDAEPGIYVVVGD